MQRGEKVNQKDDDYVLGPTHVLQLQYLRFCWPGHSAQEHRHTFLSLAAVQARPVKISWTRPEGHGA